MYWRPACRSILALSAGLSGRHLSSRRLLDSRSQTPKGSEILISASVHQKRQLVVANFSNHELTFLMYYSAGCTVIWALSAGLPGRHLSSRRLLDSRFQTPSGSEILIGSNCVHFLGQNQAIAWFWPKNAHSYYLSRSETLVVAKLATTSVSDHRKYAHVCYLSRSETLSQIWIGVQTQHTQMQHAIACCIWVCCVWSSLENSMGVHLLWTTVSGNSRLQLSTVDAHPLLSPVNSNATHSHALWPFGQIQPLGWLPVVKQGLRPCFTTGSSLKAELQHSPSGCTKQQVKDLL